MTGIGTTTAVLAIAAVLKGEGVIDIQSLLSEELSKTALSEISSPASSAILIVGTGIFAGIVAAAAYQVTNKINSDNPSGRT